MTKIKVTNPTDHVRSEEGTTAAIPWTGTTPLIGQIPLESLDLLVDPKSLDLRLNPASPDMPLLDLLAVA